MVSASSELWGLASEMDFTDPQPEPIQYCDPEARWHLTATGAKVEPFLPEANDLEEVDAPCVYCEGDGEICPDDDCSWTPPSNCYACGGTGKAGYKVTVVELRKRDWDDRVFFVDAQRAERMSYDLCPECGGGHDWGSCLPDYDPGEAGDDSGIEVDQQQMDETFEMLVEMDTEPPF